MVLLGHAKDHGHVYQQESGLQVTFEHAYFGARPPEPQRPPINSWPRARELDPLELGVHRSALEKGNAVPPYVERDADKKVRQGLTELSLAGGLLLILGDSTAGKSRAAYEALQVVIPDHRVYVPRTPGDVHWVVSSTSDEPEPEPFAIWLDDFETYLGPSGITSQDLNLFRSRKVVAIATLRTEQYRRLRAGGEAAHTEDGRLSSIDRIMNQVEPIVMDRKWTSAEIERAGAIADDSRIADAVRHQDVYGIAEYLAAGPKLMQEWRLAWAAGENPRGAALVAAAVDLARIGITIDLSLSTIAELHHSYLDDAGGALLRPEAMGTAISWATRRSYGVTSLLLPGTKEDTYRAFDYLPDALERDRKAHPISDETWIFGKVFAADRSDLLLSMGLAARAHSRLNEAAELLQMSAEMGHTDSYVYLARVLLKLDRPGEAEEWFRKAAEAGDLAAVSSLGYLLEEQLRRDEALVWHRTAAEANDPFAAYHVGWLLEQMHNLSEAEDWYRKAIAADAQYAAVALGYLLIARGRYTEAEKVFRAALSKGAAGAIGGIAVALTEQGLHEDAEEWFKRSVDDGELNARLNYGLYLVHRKRRKEALALFREAFDSGDVRAAANLGAALEDDDPDEALRLYRVAAESGFSRGALNLGIFLAAHDNDAEAEPWLRKAATMGETVIPLVRLLERKDLAAAREEAEQLLATAAKGGDRPAARELGIRHRDKGDPASAAEWLAVAAAEGDLVTNCELAALYVDAGDPDEAIRRYKISAAGGHTHAECAIGRLELRQGKLKEAEASFRNAFKAGHEHAASELVDLYTALRRFKDAAYWRKMESGAGRSKRPAVARTSRPKRAPNRRKRR